MARMITVDFLVHIVEYPVLPDAQLPNRLNMMPGRHQARDDLPIAGLPAWFLSQLYFNPIQDPGALVCAQPSEIFSDTV